MNVDQLKYDLKKYILEDYLNQPTWKLISDKLIEDENNIQEVA